VNGKPLPTAAQRFFGTSFGVDLRALALLRALLGATLFVDLWRRADDLRMFYSDIGVLPRAWLIAINGPWRISVHLANGEGWFAAAMLTAELLAALALFFGWRTRQANLVCFVLQASLLNRNPQIVLGGDVLLLGLLFWGLFLPLGARWSADAALAETPPPEDNHHRSWAAAGLLLQLLSVFFFGAILLHRQQWPAPDAGAGPVLHIAGYATALGAHLRNTPGLAATLNGCAYLFALVAPLLALAPVANAPLRFMALLALLLVTAGAGLLWRLGLLPWVAAAGLSILIDGSIWNALGRRLHRPQPAPLRIYHDRDCAICLRAVRLLRTLLILPQAQIDAAQDNARAGTLMQANRSWVVIDHDDHAYLKWPALVVLLKRSPLLWPLGYLLSGVWAVKPGNAAYDFAARYRAALSAPALPALAPHRRRFTTGRLAQAFAGAMLFVVLAWNLASVGALPQRLSKAIVPPLRLLRLDQAWDLSALFPAAQDGWYVVPAELVNGLEVDLLQPQREHIDYTRPAHLADTFSNLRREAYLERLADPHWQSSRPYYADWLCRSWNDTHPPAQGVKTLRIVYLLETAADTGQNPQPEQRVIWRHNCFASVQANAAQN
jgi:hypothetical protein